MKKLLTRFQNFVKEEDGVTMMEYVLIGALISIAAIAILPNVGAAILACFTDIDGALTAAP